MLGTIVNAITIIFGGILGVLLGNKMDQKYSEAVIKAIALSILVIGISKALETNNMLIVIISMSLGVLIGEFIDIEKKLENLGERLKNRFSKGDSSFSIGFVTATLIYCIGSMAILGSIESGLTGNHETLYTKSILDGISSVVFASTFGIGVVFSAIPVFLYQGFITITASSMKEILTPDVITEMSAVGGLLIMGLGLNMLGVNKIKVGNMLPAIFLPLIYFMFF